MIPFTSTGACRSDSGLKNFHPKIFTAIADALEWCFRRSGVTEVDHYLDDFITIAPPDSEECHHNLSTMLEVCRRLGVPLANEKLEGPSACLIFLGIEIDTMAGALRLPREKLTRIRHTLHRWCGWRTCRQRELEPLIGLLQHACQVVHLGNPSCRG